MSPAAAAVVIMAVIAMAGGRPPTSAQADPIVSVDAMSDASNTATTVGSIESCATIFNNGVKDGDETGVDTIAVDVVIQGVTNIAGFQGDLLYDPAVLRVTGLNYNYLLASTGAAVLDLGNGTPDTDGDFFMAAAMFSVVSVTGASGDGVLARLTFEAVGPGTSALDLTGVKLSDADGNPILPVDASNFYAGPINDAYLAVDAPCADGDGDTVPDASDNCPDTPNPGQENTDAELGASGATMYASPIGDGLGDACDDDDDDDGYTDVDEATIGTVGLDNCAGSPGPGGDGWPPDFDLNQTVNILDVVQLTPPVFNSSSGDPDYSQRKDLNPDGTINILDVVRVTPPVFGSDCT